MEAGDVVRDGGEDGGVDRSLSSLTGNEGGDSDNEDRADTLEVTEDSELARVALPFTVDRGTSASSLKALLPAVLALRRSSVARTAGPHSSHSSACAFRVSWMCGSDSMMTR